MQAVQAPVYFGDRRLDGPAPGRANKWTVPVVDRRVLKYIKLYPFVHWPAGVALFTHFSARIARLQRNRRCLWDFLMTALGLSMIVGGMAFLLSGLIFLLPAGRRQSARDQTFEQARNEIEFHLSQMRKRSE
jgi:hypothetical protein